MACLSCSGCWFRISYYSVHWTICPAGERSPYGPSPLHRPASENRAFLSPPTLMDGPPRLSPNFPPMGPGGRGELSSPCLLSVHCRPGSYQSYNNTTAEFTCLVTCVPFYHQCHVILVEMACDEFIFNINIFTFVYNTNFLCAMTL